ncbi:MAG: ribonuclease P protein component 4 [Candidatus Methanomethylophilaceae archaeon]
MSRRRISSRQAADIGTQRITKLTSMAVDAVKEGKPDRARRYVDLARKIGMKTRTGIPGTYVYCDRCLVPLVPGVNCTVRLNNGKVSMTCAECGVVRRQPYIKEQKHDRETRQKGAHETRQ